MKYLLLALPVLFLFSCGSPEQPVGAGMAPKHIKNCFCSDTTLNKDSLCSDIPHAPLITFNMIGYDSRMSPQTQPPFDLFSWQSFVALNYPADANGNPINSAFRTNDTSLRVWEHYVLADTVFKPGGGNHMVKLVLKPGDNRARKQLYQDSKFMENISINNTFFEADSSTLIDKNLNYVLFEERMNDDEWNYIDTADLRTEAGQLTYTTTNTIGLPAGYYGNKEWGNPTSGLVGAIEIKASWRILDPSKGDDTNRYYHQTALITIDGKYTWNGKPLAFTAIVGLTGMHIIHMTQSFPKEIWSTFEQIDNAPDSGAVDPNVTYSFYNAAYTGAPYQKPLAVNNKLAMWNDTPPYAKAYGVNEQGQLGGTFGTQAPRYYSIYVSTDSMNKVWQAKLSGTVWQYYKLVGTQWFSQETFGHFVPNAPVYLGNTTMETYIQPGASCISCHSFANIAGTPPPPISKQDSMRYAADFSFLFRHAASTADFYKQPPKK
jgi:hypothetical protein